MRFFSILLTLLASASSVMAQPLPAEPLRPETNPTWSPSGLTVQPNPANGFAFESNVYPSSGDTKFVFLKTAGVDSETFLEWQGSFNPSAASEVRVLIDASRTGGIAERDCYLEIAMYQVGGVVHRNVLAFIQSSAQTGVRWVALVLSNLPNWQTGTQVKFSAYLRRNRGNTECNALIAMVRPMQLVIPRTSTSVDDEVGVISSLRVWPNPVREMLNLNVPQGTTNVELFTLYGQRILMVTSFERLDVSTLQHGMYILRLRGSSYGYIDRAIIVQ